jgi:hypothetical protein
MKAEQNNIYMLPLDIWHLNLQPEAQQPSTSLCDVQVHAVAVHTCKPRVPAADVV